VLLLALLGVAAALDAEQALAPAGPDTRLALSSLGGAPAVRFPTIDSAVAGASLPPANTDERVTMVRQILAGRPLEAQAQLMVETADAHGIDWRLMPVISILESGGGAAACGGNAWGYANCRITFSTFEEGIEIVAATLAAPPYPGRDTARALCLWVSGNFCSTAHAVEYAYRAFGLYLALGGSFALPAPVAADTGEQPHAADAGDDGTPPPPPGPTPAPPTPSPTAEPVESAAPTGTATVEPPPATATPPPPPEPPWPPMEPE
jgi:hypothetical protein